LKGFNQSPFENEMKDLATPKEEDGSGCSGGFSMHVCAGLKLNGFKKVDEE
jgi:hypothetical protein